ncbi:MAG: hypothetical protein ACO3NZ_12185 [Pirellulales bacterium]
MIVTSDVAGGTTPAIELLSRRIVRSATPEDGAEGAMEALVILLSPAS